MKTILGIIAVLIVTAVATNEMLVPENNSMTILGLIIIFSIIGFIFGKYYKPAAKQEIEPKKEDVVENKI